MAKVCTTTVDKWGAGCQLSLCLSVSLSLSLSPPSFPPLSPLLPPLPPKEKFKVWRMSLGGLANSYPAHLNQAEIFLTSPDVWALLSTN